MASFKEIVATARHVLKILRVWQERPSSPTELGIGCNPDAKLTHIVVKGEKICKEPVRAAT